MGGGWWTSNPGSQIAADQTGTYTVMLGSMVYSSGYTGTRSFVLRQAQITQTAYTPGSEITGTLVNAQDETHYRFTLAQDTDTWLTLSGDDYQGSLVRIDAGGATLVSNGLRYSDINQVRRLAAGTYEVVLRALNSAPGSYRFVLQDHLDAGHAAGGADHRRVGGQQQLGPRLAVRRHGRRTPHHRSAHHQRLLRHLLDADRPERRPGGQRLQLLELRLLATRHAAGRRPLRALHLRLHQRQWRPHHGAHGQRLQRAGDGHPGSATRSAAALPRPATSTTTPSRWTRTRRS